MPQIDDGPTDGPPGRSIRTACVTLTSSEAHELLEALSTWAKDASDDEVDPGWHTHIAGDDGRELTLVIDAPAGDGASAHGRRRRR
jgi:hypothetical protein